ncbi:MAG: PAS domain-containing protein [Chloroflexi bacterium]|nr:PAS domain-containing protein [Chloroflexota bacterium]
MKNYDEKENHSPGLFIFIFVVMVTGISIIAYSSYQNYERQFRIQADQQLSSITELKVNGLADWRNERLEDASVLYQNPAFNELVQRYLDDPDDMQAAEQLQTWLGTIQAHYQYDKVSLFDTNTVERLSVPAAPEAMKEILVGEMPAVLESGEITFFDFHRDTPDDTLHLAILIPVFEGTTPNNSRSLGIIYMRINPDVYLYPFIQEWPTTSQTAETLIVRREGQDVVFLNALKFDESAALNLRIPLEKTDNLAVKAVLGQEGIVQGLDYRGVPSIGSVRAVPNSPWFLVARMETAEIYAPLKMRLWQTIIFFGALIASGGTGLGMVWRQQRMRFYRSQADAANALRESETYIRAVMDNLPMGVAVNTIDPSVEFTYMNDNFPRYYRTTREALAVPDAFWEAAYEEPVFRKKMKKTVLDDCATGDPQRMQWIDIPITRKGEETTFISAMNTPIPGRQLMISTVWDVTERKRAQDALVASEAKYRHTLDAMLEGCQIIGFDWRYLYLNDAAEKQNRRPREELLGKQYMDMWPGIEETEVFAVLRRSLEERLAQSIENKFTFPDGSQGWFELRIYPVPEGIVILSIDITERKHAEEQLVRYTEKLEEMVDERTHELRDAQEQLVRQEKLATLGQLAGSIGHELRNPLGVISNAIYFLKAAQPNASDKVKEYLQIMENETRTSDKIITDLLDFTRIKSVDREAGSVSELIRQTLERFPVPASVAVTLEIPPDPPSVYVDPHHIIQVPGNLIVNACQAMPDGGQLSLYSNVQNDMMNITVKDTGAGILPENMKKLFEPLFTTKARGIGLGLAVSRKLVEANGGRIEVESEPGKGSSFSVYLPIRKEAQ